MTDAQHESESSRDIPWSREAEQSVLGAVMLGEAVLDEIGGLLDAEDFFLPGHQAMFSAMRQLQASGRPADPVSLREALRTDTRMAAFGEYLGDYLAKLMTTVPSTANARAYAAMVRDKSILRHLLRTGGALADAACRPGALAEETLKEAEEALFRESVRLFGGHGERDLGAAALEATQDAVAIARGQKIADGIGTGYSMLDSTLNGGMRGGELVIIAGRSSMGKTALGINIATHAALRGRVPTLVCSLEMSAKSLARRILAGETMIPASRIHSGVLDAGEISLLEGTTRRLAGVPMLIDDEGGLSLAALRSRARRLRRTHRIGLVLVDHLQLMVGPRAENRTQELRQMTAGLKVMAKELGLPVVVLSQLSREVEKRTDKRPMLADLRESGSIEQDADVVMFVFREEYYKPDDPELVGKAELVVAKHREGATGKIELRFDAETTRFYGMDTRDFDDTRDIGL
ncbi:MAG: replicative DNA helicase [Magnetococcales bacterium]|nr:replicative DNA helicase [Magnetococcales bacterium]